MSFAAFLPLSLDIGLIGGILVILLTDLFLPVERRVVAGYLSALLLAGLFVQSFALDLSGPAFGGAYVGDELALWLKRLVYAGGFLTVLASIRYAAQRFPARQGEYYQLLLFSLLGMSLLGGARDLLFLVVAFELMGIPLYVLAAYAKRAERPDEAPAEAGIKLFITGALSSAITLYGLSLVFGAAGSLDLADIAATEGTPLLRIGLLISFAGIGFKLGAAPFHMWVPDTYQGAGNPFVAFLSVLPKVAGLIVVALIFLKGAPHLAATWIPGFTVVVVASLAIGNIGALGQRDLKRLIGFSGVAHMGFLLLALIAATSPGETGVEAFASALFYSVGYVVTNMGILFAVELIRQDGGDSSISSLDGLARRSPWLGLCALLFLLSLAGIPFVVGFWGKLYVFIAAWGAGHIGLVLIGAALSVVGLFYYLSVARAIYMNKPATEAPISGCLALKTAVLLCVGGVVGIGAYPAPWLEACRTVAEAFLR
jgi:NADH-quinone oxidoreductase subunit N